MSFNISTVDGILVHRADGSDFHEEGLTLTAAGNIAISQTAGTATFTISGTGADLSVENNGSQVVAAADTLNFRHALDVVDDGGEAAIDVDESEFTTVVFLTGDQTISGNKTFADNVVVDGDFTVNGTATTLNTAELLVEDNLITLNSNWVGSAEASGIDAGIEVNRGSDAYAQLFWDESLNRFVAGISGSFTADDEVLVIRSELDAVEADIVALSGTMDTDFLKLDGSNDPMTGDLNLASGVNILANVSGTSDLGSAANPFAELHVDLGFNYDAPTLDAHIANKAYVDAQVSSAAIAVEDDNVSVVAASNTINFALGFNVADAGSGQADITLDESEFTNVVFLSGDQTISGVKTFDSPIITASGAEPATISASGIEGEVRWADDYLYIAVATNSWKRIALAAF